MSTDSDTQPTGPATDQRAEPHTRPPLRRAASGRMLAGVAAGLANYFGVDVTIVRVIMAALGILAVVGNPLSIAGLPLYLAGIPLYLACWLLVPEEGHEQSIAAGFLRSR